MKKFNVKRVLFSFIVLLSFSSCKNFMNGIDLVEELGNSVNYANAKSVKVYVLAEEGSGAFITGGGDKYCKVTNSFEVEFQVNNKYQFIKWQAVNKKDKSISMSEYVSFSSENTLATKVTINKLPEESEILIQPLCQKHLDYKNIVPLNLSEGVSKDSSITITFSNKLSENNDVSKIEIISDGTSVKDCFETPVINEEYLIITAKKDNTIPVNKGEIKEVQIIIPSDFYYEGVGGSCIPLGSEISYTYRINSTTNDKVEILFDNANVGNISPAGNQSYNIGETQELSLTPAEGYIFKYWKVIVGDKTYSYDSSSAEKTLRVLTSEGSVALEIEDATSTYTTVKINADISGVVIKPECELSFILTDFNPELLQSGVWANTPIECTFNIPVNASTVNFSTIQITDKNGNSLTEYFNVPEVKNNKIIISPKTMDFISTSGPFNGSSTLNINVTLAKEISSESKLQLVNSNSWTIIYNKNVETNPPLFSNIVASDTEENFKLNKNLLSIKTIDTFKEPDYFSNHINNQVYLSVSFTDEDSKIGKIFIKETHTNNIDGSVDVDKVTSEPKITELSGSSLVTDENNITTANFLYTLKSTKDGAVLLEFYAADIYGNESKAKGISVIRDVDFNEKGIYYYNGYDSKYFDDQRKRVTGYATANQQDGFDVKEYSNQIKNIYINYTDYFYKDYSFQGDKINVRFLYGDDFNSLKELPLTYDSDKKMFTGCMDVNDITNKAARFIITDSNGKEYTKDDYFPGKVYVSKLPIDQYSTGSIYSIIGVMSSGASDSYCSFFHHSKYDKMYYIENRTNTEFNFPSNVYSTSINYLSGDSLDNVCMKFIAKNGDLIGEFAESSSSDRIMRSDIKRISFSLRTCNLKTAQKFSDANNQELAFNDINSFIDLDKYKNIDPFNTYDEDTKTIKITVPLNEKHDLWGYFGAIVLELTYTDSHGNTIIKNYPYLAGKYTQTFEIPAEAFFSGKMKLYYLCKSFFYYRYGVGNPISYYSKDQISSLYDNGYTSLSGVYMNDSNMSVNSTVREDIKMKFDKESPTITLINQVTESVMTSGNYPKDCEPYIEAYKIVDSSCDPEWDIYIIDGDRRIKILNSYKNSNNVVCVPLQNEFPDNRAKLLIEVRDAYGNESKAEDYFDIPQFMNVKGYPPNFNKDYFYTEFDTYERYNNIFCFFNLTSEYEYKGSYGNHISEGLIKKIGFKSNNENLFHYNITENHSYKSYSSSTGIKYWAKYRVYTHLPQLYISDYLYGYAGQGAGDECKIKDFYSSENGILYNSDQWCFIQTLVSSTEPPEFSSDEEAAAWWNHNHPIFNEQIVEPAPIKPFNFCEYKIDKSIIPEGYYYTVIIRFADGSVKLRKVEKK